jgi:hypothetical protein
LRDHEDIHLRDRPANNAEYDIAQQQPDHHRRTNAQADGKDLASGTDQAGQHSAGEFFAGQRKNVVARH